MLYERWLETVDKSGDQLALDDRINRRQWSFQELASEAANRDSRDGSEVRFPQGRDARFIIELLTAWRDGVVVCPLEMEEPTPTLSAHPPAGIVHLKQTSGTTGAKRFVLFTASQLCADADNIVATMGLSRESPNLGVISLAHSYGFSNLVLPLLLHGIPLTLAESPLPEAVRSAAATGENWTLPAVPALWQAWASAEAIPQNLRMAISAGAPLPLSLEQTVAEKFGVKIHNFLGSSECGGIAFDATEPCRNEAGAAGAALTNVEIEIGDSGCIEVRGAAVGSGYWPDENDSLRNGCFQTQDLAEWRGGALVLRGRAGDVINVSGRKVSPERIEQVLASHPAVSRCIVFGVPANSHAKNEEVVACVEWSQRADDSALREFALRSLPAWETPSQFISVETIKANIRGKVSRRDWRERFLRGELVPGD